MMSKQGYIVFACLAAAIGGETVWAAQIATDSYTEYFSPYSGVIQDQDYDDPSTDDALRSRAFIDPLSQSQILASSAASQRIDLRSVASIKTSGSVIYTNDDLRIGTLAFARSNSTYTDQVISSRSGFESFLNIIYERDINLRLFTDPSATAVATALQLRGAAIGQLYKGLSDISVSSFASLAIVDSITNEQVVSLQVRDSFDIKMDAYLTGIGFTADEHFRSFGNSQIYSAYKDKSGSIVENEEFIDRSGIAKFSGRSFSFSDRENFKVGGYFEGGRRYNVYLSSRCDVLMRGLAPITPISLSSCDSGRSLYWNGISDIQPDDGSEPVELRSLTTGFDYRSPSPALAAVPEPETWLLATIGFFLVGRRIRKKACPLSNTGIAGSHGLC